MYIKNKNIDNGKKFDWGKTSADYARFRDIYPKEFYEKITEQNLCVKGQSVLDIGTGTGVLPRNMYSYGAQWTGADISPEQIEQAKALSAGKNITYVTASAETLDFPENTFDVVTSCQCFWYFNHDILAPKLFKMLKPGGRIAVLCMEWLPFEDKIAGESEKLILKYSPQWSGGRATMQPIPIPNAYKDCFNLVYHDEYKLKVHFTRESWSGRLKACRGIGASLSEKEISKWEHEHTKLLEEIAPPEFDILHYAAIAILESRK